MARPARAQECVHFRLAFESAHGRLLSASHWLAASRGLQVQSLLEEFIGVPTWVVRLSENGRGDLGYWSDGGRAKAA